MTTHHETMKWAQHLDKGRGSRGSRPRCVLLVDGERDEVAQRLTALVDLPGVSVSTDERWQPRGRPVHMDGSWNTTPSNEVDLAGPNDLVSNDLQLELRSWWLEVHARARTPVWDMAATCTISDRPGLLLVEAKAHAGELSPAGKALPRTPNGWRNHERIGAAITEANEGLEICVRQAMGTIPGQPLPDIQPLRLGVEVDVARGSRRAGLSGIPQCRRDGGHRTDLQVGG